MIVGLGCVLPLGLVETAHDSRAWLRLLMTVGLGCVLLPLGLIETAHDSRAWLRPFALRSG
jgi:hypothetical protein